MTTKQEDENTLGELSFVAIVSLVLGFAGGMYIMHIIQGGNLI